MTDDVQDRIRAASEQNLQVAAASAPIDGTYRAQWNRFKTYIEGCRATGILPLSEFYLTRENIDYYFSHLFILFCPSFSVSRISYHTSTGAGKKSTEHAWTIHRNHGKTT